MATVIPALSTCVARMTPGERRAAERLEHKLDDDYLVWYDVPVGPKHSHPDFVVLHPRRGLLILEVKDWRLETVRSANKQSWEIFASGVPKTVPNPIEQARHYAHQVVDALSKDRRLTQHDGKLAFPWSYGVVLTHITRRQFEAAQLQHAIEPQRVICSDEMTATVDAEEFQSRLWAMFPTLMRGVLSLPQIDRVRWILFPEVRVGTQLGLFAPAQPTEDALPDIMRVMDLQQEQLARSLGEGHRVIHGVAGSGKTMILSCRAEYLAKASAGTKPILVLCYNQPLAVKLDAVMAAKGLSDKVQVRNFHRWCRQQLVAYGQPLPAQGPDMFEQMVAGVIRGVDRRQIPAGQYQAVLIDEGHDFKAEWLKLAAQMVDPSTNSLLLLYDDAQSIYQRRRTQQFSFKSVGIQAQGRTTVLKINYRNSRQVLQTASMVAADLLMAQDCGDDGVPLLHPISCGAVLVDCDNTCPEILEHTLRVVAQFGRVVVRRGYGNHGTLVNKWQEALVRLAFMPCLQYQYASGKNTSDIALAIDAMEALFDRRADIFCLVTSDSDFAYLCRKLRERGATVFVVGEAKTPSALRNASDQFFEWSRPEPGFDVAKTEVAPAEACKPVRKRRPLFIVDAIRLLGSESPEGKIHLGYLGQYLKRTDPAFTPQTHGYAGLLDMLRTYDLLKLQQEAGGHWSVRLAPETQASKLGEMASAA